MIRENIEEKNGIGEIFITFKLPLSQKFTIKESLSFIGKQGYRRIIDPTIKVKTDSLPKVLRIEDAVDILCEQKLTVLSVLQDRMCLTNTTRPRFFEAIELIFSILSIRITPVRFDN